ncbi:HAD-like protein [Auricularia subglabra TFB-10046 SS5]|nr:HAD-like protein [Auricularia subglabra TFB-10046 SS5]
MVGKHPQPHPQSPYTTLICDLGDVFCLWSPPTESIVPPRTLHAILRSSAWEDFERGQTTAETCYALAAKMFGLDAAAVRGAFTAAAESVCLNEPLVAFVRILKRQHNLTVYAMTNVGLEHAEAVMPPSLADALFDRVFTSCDAGARKPERAFFEHVLGEIAVDPGKAIFFDDKAEHIRMANQLGIRGITFRGNESFIPLLAGALDGALQRGNAYLRSHAGKMASFYDTGEICMDNFTQLLILELTGNREWVTIIQSENHRFNFFQGRAAEQFPCDLDTTSLAFTTLSLDCDETRDLVEGMLSFRGSDGVFQVYFDHARPRVCATACLNILTLLCSEGRAAEASATLAYARAVLERRGYLPSGTRYYPSPDAFLFFACRLLQRAPQLRADWGPTLTERLAERVGAPGDAVSLALRLLACAAAGVTNERDLATLYNFQKDDGSWSGWIFSMPAKNIRVGNDGLATALATRAIQAYECQPVEPWHW